MGGDRRGEGLPAEVHAASKAGASRRSTPACWRRIRPQSLQACLVASARSTGSPRRQDTGRSQPAAPAPRWKLPATSTPAANPPARAGPSATHTPPPGRCRSPRWGQQQQRHTGWRAAGAARAAPPGGGAGAAAAGWWPRAESPGTRWAQGSSLHGCRTPSGPPWGCSWPGRRWWPAHMLKGHAGERLIGQEGELVHDLAGAGLAKPQTWFSSADVMLRRVCRSMQRTAVARVCQPLCRCL